MSQPLVGRMDPSEAGERGVRGLQRCCWGALRDVEPLLWVLYLCLGGGVVIHGRGPRAHGTVVEAGRSGHMDEEWGGGGRDGRERERRAQ